MDTKRCLLILVSLFLFLSSALPQGDLNPPGPPGPTMKTLQQIEPRVDLLTVAGDGDYQHIINTPGSYYLSGNLDVLRPTGIVVRAVGVTIDLNGFQIQRIFGSGGNGIEIEGGSHRCTVKNGTISGFANGLNAGSAEGGTILQVTVHGCSGIGIWVGSGWELTGCEVHENPGVGILIGSASTISRCTALANGGAGIDAAGNGVTISNCTARDNGSHGISVNFSSSVQECTVSRNRGDGIEASSENLLRANICSRNGDGTGSGAGVHTTGIRNRIEGNLVTENDRGIDVDGTGNFILKNSASGNSTNYDIAADNVFGEVVDRTAPASAAISGNSAASSAGTTDPWANISH